MKDNPLVSEYVRYSIAAARAISPAVEQWYREKAKHLYTQMTKQERENSDVLLLQRSV